MTSISATTPSTEQKSSGVDTPPKEDLSGISKQLTAWTEGLTSRPYDRGRSAAFRWVLALLPKESSKATLQTFLGTFKVGILGGGTRDGRAGFHNGIQQVIALLKQS
jgi:hypothetical protein